MVVKVSKAELKIKIIKLLQVNLTETVKLKQVFVKY